jgi:hypothetical protein
VRPTLNATVAAQRSAIPAGTAQNIPTQCFPENYLISNPQLSGATYNANLGRNNYHSLQVQFTMRPLRPSDSFKRFQRSAIRGSPSKEEFDRRGGWVLNKTQSLTKSVGLVRRSGASANERKKNPALFLKIE